MSADHRISLSMKLSWSDAEVPTTVLRREATWLHPHNGKFAVM